MKLVSILLLPEVRTGTFSRCLDWVIYHASYLDDLSKPIEMVNYGKGNGHLELRGKYRHDYYLPDLNGRRYNNYMMAYQLSEVAGKILGYLSERAEALKPLLKKQLWSSENKWFFVMFNDGRKELRYTVQMYKMFGSSVLDREQEAGLLSHLNEEEFLSPFGIYSISKKDPAYDQVDIDARALHKASGNHVKASRWPPCR
jgi:hypothetical protein